MSDYNLNLRSRRIEIKTVMFLIQIR